MKSINLISDKLFELNDVYADIYPKFYLAELNYMNRKAKVLMSQEIVGLGSQPLRDAECQRLMSLTEEYEEYHKLLPEINIINMQIKIYMQLSRNVNNMAWQETQ